MAAAPWVTFKRMQVRVPWWLILLVLTPVVLFHVARFTFRHRRALPWLAAVVGLLWALHRYGWLPLALITAGLGIAVGLWYWRRPAACRRWVLLPLLSRWRRLWVYHRQWAESLTLSGLHKSFDGRTLLPRLVSVRSKDATDEVLVRMLRGQVPDMFHKAAANLAYSFGFRQCRVFSTRRAVAPYRASRFLRLVDRWRFRDRPRFVTLVFIRRDALTTTVQPFPVPRVPDFTALVVGLREDLERYALCLLATHVLIAGATRAGKGSVIWSILRALAGGIASGLVRVWGMDPKGGMELALGRELFSRFEFAEYAAMADMLDELVRVMRRRQAALSGKVRVHTPTVDDPLYVLIIDELSALTAYLYDSDLKARILGSLALLLSQGAGLGILVVAATQDPRKETVALRDLFPTRIALRLNEPGHVNLILGDGARDRGALCDQIPNTPAGKGIGYVNTDDQPEPMRVRFSYLTDGDIFGLAEQYPAAPELLPPADTPAPTKAIRRRNSSQSGPLLPDGLLNFLRREEPEQ